MKNILCEFFELVAFPFNTYFTDLELSPKLNKLPEPNPTQQ